MTYANLTNNMNSQANILISKSAKMDMEMLSSVWNINTVNPFLDRDVANPQFNPHRHPTIFPEELAYRIIELFSDRGNVVLDPFCGTGTTSAAALKMGRKAIGYDLSEEYIRTANKRCKNKAIHFCKSSEKMDELKDNVVDLCFTSPPYLGLKKFTNHPDDISFTKTPYVKLQNALREIYRVLKHNGTLCLNVCDVPKEHGYLSTFPFDMIYLAIKSGFQLVHTIIWKKTIRLNPWNIINRRIRYNHEYIWIFNKPTR